MSAVINLVTKKSGDATSGSLLFQAGGFGTYGTQLQVNTRVAKNKFGISVQNYSTDGFSAAKDSLKKGKMMGCANNPFRSLGLGPSGRGL